ncbi:integrating conjugative element membrane protein, PFL_4697 family [Burkholderia pseudomallei]|uniref:TIGR03747 family integrating conjugative element membrane protein n=1 Tax=Burkholderia pseudomallei TaxID=28450 RepID=UPI000976F458|nr:TIGR03747 family integrating conjugative element membrane protein [Burkholderia pseudomallei]MBF4045268.1 TIGR03747 family integrating conjugative element membrane protein [Burkholderia pseudomallei]OMU05145.1 integrating conjugative element membrane protein [Burkholderia pseudomallei]CAJ3543964.1 integrating conjugative element membrane protein, PFL_4697 family [Burkholderia pseudomallei]CAJ4985555.1 integrating conjugative element membrane protein, PFL_4697 family [Burkholderia pseudomalle
MTDPATTAQRQQAQQQGLIAQILTLPFRFLGALIGSLFLAMLIEWAGMLILWPDQGWHHAQLMLRHETDQLAAEFFDSLVVHEPAHTAQVWLDTAYRLVFVKTGLLAWIRDADAQTHANSMRGTDLRHYLGLVAVHLEDYLLAALYTCLTFLVRLLVLIMVLPLFVVAAFTGFVDGLVRRDIRRFGAGRESGFLHHRAKATVMPLAVLPWIAYLALPISTDPLLVLLPCAALLGLSVDVTVGSFKKHL